MCSSSSDDDSTELNAGPNAYEQEREERIKRNMAVMASMGLVHLGRGLSGQPSAQAQKGQPPRKRPKRAPVDPASQLAGRTYALRTRGAPPPAEQAADVPMSEEQSEAAQQPLVYDDSSVLSYVCQVSASSSKPADVADGTSITCFAQLGTCLVDNSLARAYSLDVQGDLLVAGGKDGRAAVWGIRGIQEGTASEDVQPLLSTKLHKGWISDVQFATAGSRGGGPPLLLSASNDGSLAVWDLSKCTQQGGQAGGLPQHMSEATTLHSGGIFSMHEVNGRIVTTSKDASVAVSQLGAAGEVKLLHAYPDQHQGVVKCARWQSTHLFASCGNDGCIRIVDVRQPDQQPACIQDAHAGPVNYLRWHPTNGDVLLSAGTDPNIQLFDLRRLPSPVHTFSGHINGKCSQIYQPVFVVGGDAIASGGQRSHKLSIYSTTTGETISRGHIGFDPVATHAACAPQSPFICATTKAVYFYQPQWALRHTD
ncbi:hypothetical protein WJX72_011510 [[Myrmecia] bisecta]|uniref:Uncharacterized protein n=1 Tax=[Myrmecia] bisecta TaxID=41462 RepID=A0AAW1R9Q7_9CHLO